jgi:RNA polymerase sigma-70 factor (ECF subfamily)
LLNGSDAAMAEKAIRAPIPLTAVDEHLEQEFEARLVESSTLAFRVAFGVLRHREDAEDVAQEALTKAYRTFRQLRDRTRFRVWLVRMVWRLAINRQRLNRRRMLREQVTMTTPDPPNTDTALLTQERAARLWAAIDALPEKLRVVTVLAGIEEHDIREVALLLALPEGTVKSRLFLGRQRLRELLK